MKAIPARPLTVVTHFVPLPGTGAAGAAGGHGDSEKSDKDQEEYGAKLFHVKVFICFI